MGGEKKDSQSRGWLITASAEKFTREDITKALGGYTGVRGQLEEGEEKNSEGRGYKHWQLYVEHASPIRFSTLKRKLPSAHLDKRKGSKQQALAYVTKKETRVEDEPPIEIGVIETVDEQGKRSDLSEIRAAILEEGATHDEVMLSFPNAPRHARFVQELISARDRTKHKQKLREVRTEYWWGDPGAGKTARVFEETNGLEDTYRVTSYKHPFDGYEGESTLVLDEFAGKMQLDVLLNLLDRYPMVLPARYADKQAAFSRVIIVSNLAPWELYMGAAPKRRLALARRLTEVAWVRPPKDENSRAGTLEVFKPLDVIALFADTNERPKGWLVEKSRYA